MKPMTKRDKIIFLLDHWQDLFEPTSTTGLPNSSLSRTTSDWDGPSITALSKHPSVKELRRCVELLRHIAKGRCAHYAHLRGHYGAEWRTIDTHITVRGPKGKPVTLTTRTKQRIIPPWVNPRIVDRATDFLEGQYNGDPQIPLAFDRKLRTLADSDGWTEAA